jgi:hypothetical protein
MKRPMRINPAPTRPTGLMLIPVNGNCASGGAAVGAGEVLSDDDVEIGVGVGVGGFGGQS